jgi:hypothetical protein
MGIIGAVEVLGVFPHEEMDIIGEILGKGKTFETVCDEVLLEGELVPEGCMEGDGLAGESSDAVSNNLIGDSEKPGEGTNPAAAGVEVVEDLLIGEMFFHPVVEGEGLGGKLGSTLGTDEPLCS